MQECVYVWPATKQLQDYKPHIINYKTRYVLVKIELKWLKNFKNKRWKCLSTTLIVSDLKKTKK